MAGKDGSKFKDKMEQNVKKLESLVESVVGPTGLPQYMGGMLLRQKLLEAALVTLTKKRALLDSKIQETRGALQATKVCMDSFLKMNKQMGLALKPVLPKKEDVEKAINGPTPDNVVPLEVAEDLKGKALEEALESAAKEVDDKPVEGEPEEDTQKEE